jgi:sugar/nucleoside kinase (ribokinase family)
MRVLGIGHCTLDHIGVVERFAEPDFKVELEQLSLQGGGSAATALVALARWGRACEFIGKVGADERGQQILATLTGEGIAVERVVREPGAMSQMSFIIVEPASGRKKTYFTYGSVSPLVAGEVALDALDGAQALLVDGTCPDAQMKLMREASARGLLVVLDATAPTAAVAALIPEASVTIGSERVLSQLTGMGDPQQMCAHLIAGGTKIAVVTMGDEGCVAMSAAGELVRAAAYPVRVLDTTGAGDVFHGAFIQAMLMEFGLERAARFANAAAALSCTGIGGRGRIASLDELLALV